MNRSLYILAMKNRSLTFSQLNSESLETFYAPSVLVVASPFFTIPGHLCSTVFIYRLYSNRLTSSRLNTPDSIQISSGLIVTLASERRKSIIRDSSSTSSPIFSPLASHQVFASFVGGLSRLHSRTHRVAEDECIA